MNFIKPNIPGLLIGLIIGLLGSIIIIDFSIRQFSEKIITSELNEISEMGQSGNSAAKEVIEVLRKNRDVFRESIMFHSIQANINHDANIGR